MNDLLAIGVDVQVSVSTDPWSMYQEETVCNPGHNDVSICQLKFNRMLNKIPEVACPFSKSVDVESQTCRCEHRSSRIHLVFIKTEERDGKRNPETSSRRQDNPSQNLRQNVELHRVFMATYIPKCSL